MLDSDGFKRNVISIPLSDIELVLGDENTGVLKIYRKNGRRHHFNKSDSKRKKYRFSNDELRYLVNLLASLINKDKIGWLCLHNHKRVNDSKNFLPYTGHPAR